MTEAGSILFETDRFLAVEKPPGVSMATRPGDPDSERRVLEALGAPDPAGLFLVHRLDVGTTGVVLLARDAEAHRAASRLFQERSIAKTYRAIVWGRPSPAQGSIEAALALDRRDRRKMKAAPAGKAAVTGYATIERLPSITLLELKPETGRTHQIRVHLASRGHPIVGDDLYGGPRWHGVRDPSLRRALAGAGSLLLHASSLAFRDPFTGVATTIRSEEPARGREILAAARAARGSGR
jgi:23S rRNA pseudouridine1911/1915/1917 synthase